MTSLFARAVALGLMALVPGTALAQSVCASPAAKTMCPPPPPGKSISKAEVEALATRFGSEERDIASVLKTSRGDRCQQALAIAKNKGRIDIVARLERHC